MQCFTYIIFYSFLFLLTLHLMELSNLVSYQFFYASSCPFKVNKSAYKLKCYCNLLGYNVTQMPLKIALHKSVNITSFCSFLTEVQLLFFRLSLLSQPNFYSLIIYRNSTTSTYLCRF